VSIITLAGSCQWCSSASIGWCCAWMKMAWCIHFSHFPPHPARPSPTVTICLCSRLTVWRGRAHGPPSCASRSKAPFRLQDRTYCASCSRPPDTYAAAENSKPAVSIIRLLGAVRGASSASMVLRMDEDGVVHPLLPLLASPSSSVSHGRYLHVQPTYSLAQKFTWPSFLCFAQ
jgi:hypothetical protein